MNIQSYTSLYNPIHNYTSIHRSSIIGTDRAFFEAAQGGAGWCDVQA